MGTSSANGNNIFPTGDITLPVRVIPNGNHGTIGFQSYSMVTACADGHNILPIGNITLSVPIGACGNHGAIRFQTHSIVDSRADSLTAWTGDFNISRVFSRRYGGARYPDNDSTGNNQERENGGDYRQALPGLTGRSARMLGFF